MRIVLQAGASQSIPANGLFLFLAAATGPVYITATLDNRGPDGVPVPGKKQTSIKLNPKDQAEFRQEFVEIVVRNLHDAANTIEIETGFVRYIPKIEGGEVQITGQTVPLTVEFDTPPAVTVNGGINAQITDPVEVFTNPAAPLLVEQALVVETEENSPGTVVPGAELTLATQATIAANVDRVALHLKAPTGNTGAVWLGSAVSSGISLEPGDEKVIYTTAAVTCTAATSGDKLQFLETVR